MIGLKWSKQLFDGAIQRERYALGGIGFGNPGTGLVALIALDGYSGAFGKLGLRKARGYAF